MADLKYLDSSGAWSDPTASLEGVLSLSDIQAAVTAANAAKSGVVGSDLGGFGLEKGQKYVPSAQMKSFSDALSAASGPITMTTTQANVDSLASALRDATKALTAQIQTARWTSPANISDASWEEIAALCDTSHEDPEAFYAFYKGQEKTFKLKKTTYGSDVTIRVMDCENMDLASGGKCGLYFVVMDGLGTQQMNTSNTTTGGYPNMPMHKTTVPNILTDFPDEVQGKFAKLKLHVHTSPNASSDLAEVECDAHCLTMFQVFGEENLRTSYPSQLEWWKTEEKWLRWFQEHDTSTDRIFKNSGHSASYAWSSSVYSSSGFGRVVNSGTPGSYNASGSYVPALGFSLTNG